MKFLALWILLPALAYAAAARPQAETAPKQAAPARVSGSAGRALQERLDAVEREEAALAELSRRLAEGDNVRAADLWRAWLPGAIYAADEDEREEITGAAAELTMRLLETKDLELEALRMAKHQVEQGEAVPLDALEDLVPLGLEGRRKALEEHEEELAGLQARLEDLQFQDRFRRSADLGTELSEAEQSLLGAAERKKNLDAGAPEEATAEPGDPSVPIDPFHLAEACYRAERFEQALAVLEKIDSAAHAEGDRVLYLGGRCRERLGDLKRAEEAYRHVRKTYPGSFWARQAEFALSAVKWRQDLGPVEGAPSEVWRILDEPERSARK